VHVIAYHKLSLGSTRLLEFAFSPVRAIQEFFLTMPGALYASSLGGGF
jgi:hypothetical protein